jgi:regulator of protease activity HflC (stomatin/prohibitin superfamily)
VYGSGTLWKWPWPLERAEVYDVTRVRALPVTPQNLERRDVNLWGTEIKTREELKPFLMRSAAERVTRGAVLQEEVDAPGGDVPSEPAAQQSLGGLALVEAQVMLLYRIRDDGQGLLDYLRFASERRRARSVLDNREAGLKILALREVSAALAEHAAEELLTGGGEALSAELAARVQQSFDRHRTGVDVVAVVLLGVRPPSQETAIAALDVDMARQNRLRAAAEAEAARASELTIRVGDAHKAGPILAAIDRYEAMRQQFGEQSPEALQAREQADRLIAQAGGMVSSLLDTASRDRWVSEMDARGRAEKLLGQLPAYRAAPRLFRERQVMEAFADALGPIRKYVIAIDPGALNLDIEFKELNPLLTADLTNPADTSQGSNP